MMIVTGLRGIPVGRIYDPSRKRGVRYHRGHGYIHAPSLEHASGSSVQPFFVLREVTQAEYIAWYEAEQGRMISAEERRRELRPSAVRFYEISVD